MKLQQLARISSARLPRQCGFSASKRRFCSRPLGVLAVSQRSLANEFGVYCQKVVSGERKLRNASLFAFVGSRQ